MGKSICEVVVTGGPCAGKTTAFAHLHQWLSERGIGTVFVTEVAREVIGGAFPDIGRLAANDYERYLLVQKQMLLMQMEKVRRARELARVRPEERVAVIYDRGPMDAGAYMSPDDFRFVLEECGFSREKLLACFNGVIHLISAANGAEAFYAQDAERHETPEEARVLDEKTQRMWWGHPHLRVIDNSTNFESKMKRVIQALARMLGIPVPLEIERKFLVLTLPDFSLPPLKNAVATSIEQIYLNDGARLRKRGQEGAWTYYETKKAETGNARVRTEIERQIDPMEYLALKGAQDPETGVVRKTRYSFTHEDQYFELDVFDEPKGLILLEIELTEENDEVRLPPFLDIEREVTEDHYYRNHEIARRLASLSR